MTGISVCICVDNDREWRKHNKENNRSVSKEMNASSQTEYYQVIREVVKFPVSQNLVGRIKANI